jgi:hypothetical protein
VYSLFGIVIFMYIYMSICIVCTSVRTTAKCENPIAVNNNNNNNNNNNTNNPGISHKPILLKVLFIYQDIWKNVILELRLGIFLNNYCRQSTSIMQLNGIKGYGTRIIIEIKQVPTASKASKFISSPFKTSMKLWRHSETTLYPNHVNRCVTNKGRFINIKRRSSKVPKTPKF